MKEKLRKSLEELHAEIDKLGGEDEGVKERVKGLAADLERQLEHPEDGTEKNTLLESLQNFKEQFEVEHPRVTGILSQIMVTLSNMGI